VIVESQLRLPVEVHYDETLLNFGLLSRFVGARETDYYYIDVTSGSIIKHET